VVLASLVLLGSPTGAHEVRPAYLELRESGPERWDALWKVPARDDRRLGIYVRLPGTTRTATPPTGRFVAGAFVERWSFTAPGGLAGGVVAIDGLVGTQTDVLARIERADGTTQVARLTPAEPAFRVEASASQMQVATTYLALGVEHILGGFDHLLFVLVLFLLARSWWSVAGTVSAFTVAHSITLGAATLGLVAVPGPPVEAAIALSIVLVAVEIVHARCGRTSLTERRPWLVAFAFGLLHGLGFAGALRDVGLPQHAIPLALLFFNVGVELGQLAFVAAIAALAAALNRIVPRLRRLDVAVAYAIGVVASYWVVERTVAFWS
jgi:hydrogenase/urease accessory protein HupE